MIKIYGSFVSRATRNLWMLEELGLEYEHVSLDWAKQENRSAAYLKINPAGKVPTLEDGDATLSESLGINLYLVQKYGQGGLWPDDDAGR
ncbi:MAG: glutathione S-transferase, partial [Rhodospirillaceae bacterium]|nr:glutathione S-transferase [Rhodospirillaceae bacterium]